MAGPAPSSAPAPKPSAMPRYGELDAVLHDLFATDCAPGEIRVNFGTIAPNGVVCKCEVPLPCALAGHECVTFAIK